MVREGKVVEVDTLSELGIFGTYVSRDGKVRCSAEPFVGPIRAVS